MVAIAFPDHETEKRALAFLLPRFSGKVLRAGDHLVPEAALEVLVDQNIAFLVRGKATDEQQMAATVIEPAGDSTDGTKAPAKGGNPMKTVPTRGEPADEQNAATIALLESWLEEDATDDPDEIQRAQEELERFKQAINAERERAGARRIYP